MDVFKRMMVGFSRSEVIFSAYMINKRDSDYRWKTQLEALCENSCAKVRSHRWEIVYESMRVNMMIDNIVKSGAQIPEHLLSRLEHLNYAIDSGVHAISSAFEVTISVNMEELSQKQIDLGSIEKLKAGAIQILAGSDPLYLSQNR